MKKPKLRKGDLIEVLEVSLAGLIFPGFYKIENVSGKYFAYETGYSSGLCEIEYLPKYRKVNIKPSKINWKKQQRKHEDYLENFQGSHDYNVINLNNSPNDIFGNKVEVRELKLP